MSDERLGPTWPPPGFVCGCSSSTGALRVLRALREDDGGSRSRTSVSCPSPWPQARQALLTVATRTAWSLGPRRVWLHTCTLAPRRPAKLSRPGLSGLYDGGRGDRGVRGDELFFFLTRSGVRSRVCEFLTDHDHVGRTRELDWADLHPLKSSRRVTTRPLHRPTRRLIRNNLPRSTTASLPDLSASRAAGGFPPAASVAEPSLVSSWRTIRLGGPRWGSAAAARSASPKRTSAPHPISEFGHHDAKILPTPCGSCVAPFYGARRDASPFSIPVHATRTSSCRRTAHRYVDLTNPAAREDLFNPDISSWHGMMTSVVA